MKLIVGLVHQILPFALPTIRSAAHGAIFGGSRIIV
jgi:hypothetical protein